MKKILKKVFILIIVACLAVGAWAVVQLLKEKNTDKGDVLVETYGFAEIGELNTSEFYFTLVEKYEGDAKKVFDIELPFTSPRLTYSIDGYAKAGIDFSKIKLFELADTIMVQIPEAHITELNVDMNSMMIFEETKGLFNSVRTTDTAASVLDIEKKAKDLALEKGILDNARENAKSIIRSIMEKTLNGRKKIDFYQ